MGVTAADADSERPRSRRWLSILGLLAPIVVLAVAVAWFIRAYVMPPMITISEAPAISVAVATPAAPTAPPAATARLETLGASPPAAPSPVPSFAAPTPARAASVWDSVPLPSPPRQTQGLAATSGSAIGEANTTAVPLPPVRPRFITSDFDLPAVPLPRPRPPSAN